MKLLFSISVLSLFLSCNDKTVPLQKTAPILGDKKPVLFCWSGFINNTIPVFIQYEEDSCFVYGTITYRKFNKSFTVAGVINKDSTYSLSEFSANGSVTGLIEARVYHGNFSGSWISTSSEWDASLQCPRKDTVINVNSMDDTTVCGTYHYDYGKTGSSGNLITEKTANNKVTFELLALSSVSRGPNTAEIEKDTIVLKEKSFTYRLPHSDCEVYVHFFKKAAFVQYKNNNDCSGQFGEGASAAGVYLKMIK